MDTVVVGGGLAGLVAAWKLARGGASVTLVERGSLGGRARSTTVDGVVHNMGPHALYAGGALATVLREVGVATPGRAPDGPAVALRAGGLVPLPTGPWDTLVGPWARGGRARLAWTLVTLSRAPEGVSFGAWLTARGLPPAAFDLLVFLARTATYVADPRRLDAAQVAAQVGLALQPGVVYVDDGWQRLVDGLAAAARQAGVSIREHVDVTAVREEADGVVVTAGDQRLRAASAVLAVPPKVEAHLRGAPPPVLEPVRAACLDVVLHRLPVPERPAAFGADVARYLSAHSVYASLGPDDRVLVHVAAYLSGDEAVSRDALEAVLDAVQPGWREVLRHARYVPSWTVSEDVPSVGRSRLPLVVSPRVVRCGEHVGRRAMLADAAAASAVDAASALLRTREVRAA